MVARATLAKHRKSLWKARVLFAWLLEASTPKPGPLRVMLKMVILLILSLRPIVAPAQLIQGHQWLGGPSTVSKMLLVVMQMMQALVGDTAFVEAKFGQGIEMDNEGDYAEVVTILGVANTSTLSVSAWIKIKSFGTGALG